MSIGTQKNVYLFYTLFKKSSTQRFSFCRPWQKLNLRVLKPYKLPCFKTSFLLGTTAVRARSEF
ncbi:hypothetical protein DWQ65_06095 [Treponema phagedenis]|uniref:Uncharacterized protein n=1 Tax=Treponema phagedenis TaxID=162 RepID=A0AAE6ISZ0_TREPH|nr:hypothetical protein FUT79_05750 [Treponema phagedenis]QEJ97698.1 hypothetical protein FUT82_06605 [Treponema phagedenis]QEK00667.1 hypothetical protein FUT84_05440 [Treponema phagedenis]QEK03266.1 hypothetical protein FUT83_05215 [Treponema phagedenis]QEK05676.1 hypothetical protein FUT80_02360 [Treponema phagedenis]